MSMKKTRLQLTLHVYVNDYLHQLMEELGCNKSEIVEECIIFTSMPEIWDSFRAQFTLEGEEEEEEDDEEEDDEEEDDEEEDDEEE
ncbi:unnamed protein product [marine sediment metagenome]|uniref:Uncharacterized protein n=1 Tax=marine sediment metagenome TaxID=412755 RepID=X1MRR3_9ZZZZ